MTVKQYQDELLKLIEDAVNTFEGQLPAIERNMLSRIQLLIKELEIKNGTILNTTANLKLIGRINAELKSAILSPKYLEAVQEFVNVFNKVATLQQKYFKTNFNELPAKEKLDLIQKQSKDAIVKKLTGSGLDANVVSEVEDILRKNITTGGSYNALSTQMQEFMVSGAPEQHFGKISAYAKTIVVDAINQFSAQYHEIVTEDLGLEWRMYVGSNIATTREFCELMTEKKYVHRSELPQIIKGLIDGHQCKINPRTKLWYGAIEGTTIATLPIDRGGHRCGHQFIAVSRMVVPKEIRMKFEK